MSTLTNASATANLITHLGTVHLDRPFTGTLKVSEHWQTKTVCGAVVTSANRTNAAVTCGRCARILAAEAKRAAKAEAAPMLPIAEAEAEAAPVVQEQNATSAKATAEAVTAERLAAARAARKAALIARNWELAKAKRAERAKAEELAAAKRWEELAKASRAPKAKPSNALTAGQARAKATANAAAKAAEAKAEALAKVAAVRHAARAEARAEELASMLAKRQAEAKRQRGYSAMVAGINSAEVADFRNTGGAWAARIGAAMETRAKAALSADSNLAEVAAELGREASAVAEDWADEKDAMRQRRGQRAAARAEELAFRNRRPKAEVLAYRQESGYALGAKVLAELGRDVMAVVTSPDWGSADVVTVAEVTRVPQRLDEKVASAERALVRASAKLAEAEANAKATHSASRPKATTAKALAKAAEAEAKRPVTKAEATQLASVAKATAKVAEAKALAEEWANVPTANGLALVTVGHVTNRASAKARAKQLAAFRADMAERWDGARAEVMKAAKGHAKADPTANAALAKLAKPKAANGTVTAEAKNEATRRRMAEYRERKRQAAGISAARRYNTTARNAGK